MQLADVLFSLYGCAMEAIAAVQLVLYRRSEQAAPVHSVQHTTAAAATAQDDASTGGLTHSNNPPCSMCASVTRTGAVTTAVTTAALMIGAFALASTSAPPGSWLQYLSAIAYVKLGVTIAKYVPQIVLNYQRKTTDGFHIGGIVLDVTGSVLSLLQLVYECTITAEWSGAEGDPVKFGLGCLTLLADVVLLLQRFVLYPPAAGSRLLGGEKLALTYGGSDDTAPLLLARATS